MKCYYGEVHAHTNESDGKGTPMEAYPYARDVGKVDYFSVTDHNFGKFNAERFFSLMPPLAEEMNEDGKFAALYGYEMTYGAPSGFYGHANIIPPKEIFWTNLSLDEWYDEMARIGEDGVGQFNHPGDKWGNFNDFKFDARMDKIFSIMELRITEYGISCIEEEYDKCLARGWHISPVSNEDTHGANWTTAREEMGCVLAESLTRENIMDGMRKNRTMATTDRSFQLYYKANGEWMGARLPKTGSLHVEIDAVTEKECGLGVLQLVGEHNKVLCQVDAGAAKEYHWEVTIPDDQKYTYVKRISGMHYAISGPVWVEQTEGVAVEIETNYQNGNYVAVAKIVNHADAPLENVTVTWTPACASAELSAPSYASTVAEIPAGQSESAAFVSPVLPKITRLIASVRATCRGEEIAVNKVVYLSALAITQFFSNTGDYAAATYTVQPFCAFDLYNRTDRPLDITPYQFRIYNCGAHKEFRIARTIPAHGYLTVWLKGDGETNTLDDFNAYYGTTLTAEEVYEAPFKFAATDGTRRMGICYGDETICRAEIRGDGYHKAHVKKTGCFRYAPVDDCATMQVLELRQEAAPGERFRFEKEPLALPKATVHYTEAPLTAPRRVVILCDGTLYPEALVEKVKKAIPTAEEVISVFGDNDGTKWMHGYWFGRGEKLLLETLSHKPDAVVIATGGNDLGRKDYFLRNFVAFSTVAVNLTRGFYTRNIPLYFTTPVLSAEQAVHENMLVHNTKMVADQLWAGLIACPEEEILSAKNLEKVCVRPREDAIRVALVGDQFSMGHSAAPAYGKLLQNLLGDGYAVNIYAANKNRVAKGAAVNFLETADSDIRAMKKWEPQIIVSWFGMADLSRENSTDWEELKPRLAEGYRETIAVFREICDRVILISPFRRYTPDMRQAVIDMDGGMHDVIASVAEESGCGFVDFRTPTKEEGMIALYSKVDNLTPKATETLANLVARSIGDLHI